MTLQLGGGLGHLKRSDHPADTPARHRIGLGHAVQHQQLPAAFRHGGTDVGGVRIVIVQVLVDLVGDNPNVVLDGPTTDRFHGFRLPDGSGRVVRGVDDDCLRMLGTGRFQRLKRGLEVHVGTGEYFDRHTTGKLHSLGVAGPVRSGNDDLIAIVEQNLERFVDGLLAAVGHHDLIGIDLIAGIAQHLSRNRFAQLGQARRRRVLVILRVKAGICRSLDHVCGGREIRFTCAEADNVKSGGLHGLGLGIDGERSARCHSVDTVGKSLPLRHSHGSHAKPTARKIARAALW